MTLLVPHPTVPPLRKCERHMLRPYVPWDESSGPRVRSSESNLLHPYRGVTSRWDVSGGHAGVFWRCRFVPYMTVYSTPLGDLRRRCSRQPAQQCKRRTTRGWIHLDGGSSQSSSYRIVFFQYAQIVLRGFRALCMIPLCP